MHTSFSSIFLEIRNQTNCFGMQIKLCLPLRCCCFCLFIHVLTLQLNQRHCRKNPSATSICSDVMMALMVYFVWLFILLIKTEKGRRQRIIRIEREKRDKRKGHKRYSKRINQLLVERGQSFQTNKNALHIGTWLTCAVMLPLFWRYFEFRRHRIRTTDPDAQSNRQLLQFYRTAGAKNTWLCPNLECDIGLSDGHIWKIWKFMSALKTIQYNTSQGYWWHIQILIQLYTRFLNVTEFRARTFCEHKVY